MKFNSTGRASGRSILAQALAIGAVSMAAWLGSACSDAEPGGGEGGQGGQGGEPGQTGGAPGTGGVSPDGGGEGGQGPGGAGGGSGGGAIDPEIEVLALEDLSVTSSLDYDQNEYGIISGSTLAAYHRDWETNRPAEASGRLVILQVLGSGQAAQAIVSNPDGGVFSFILPAAKVAQPRSNGVSNFETDIPDGPTADALLKLYGLDPTSDFLVLTFEAPTGTASSVVHSVGRAWVFFNYWGWPKERLAILNGSINVNGAVGGDDPDKLPIAAVAKQKFNLPPNDGTKSFRDLHRDQTVTSISLEEILELLDEPTDGPNRSKVRIVDARGGAEALGLKKATSTGRTTCASYATAVNKKCSTPFEGRIKGAQSVPWTGFLQGIDQGYKFLPPAQAKVLFDQQSGWVDGQHESTIQYCRTNQRSTVTGIVANLILGYPTRLYETSFIEWGHISAGPGSEEAPNTSLVAADFPFRTDLPQYTEHAVLDEADSGAYVPGGTLGTLTQPVTWVDGPNYNDEQDVSPPSTLAADPWPRLNPAGTTTRASIEEDKAYLRAD